mmetsp:Transcript_6990/g.15255  ORF Transcript_6990/g.15255 Transcript_6990/m.15255 type:complete len:291 (-) Transcript_6990:1074-1946(-)
MQEQFPYLERRKVASSHALPLLIGAIILSTYHGDTPSIGHADVDSDVDAIREILAATDFRHSTSRLSCAVNSHATKSVGLGHSLSDGIDNRDSNSNNSHDTNASHSSNSSSGSRSHSGFCCSQGQDPNSNHCNRNSSSTNTNKSKSNRNDKRGTGPTIVNTPSKAVDHSFGDTTKSSWYRPCNSRQGCNSDNDSNRNNSNNNDADTSNKCCCKITIFCCFGRSLGEHRPSSLLREKACDKDNNNNINGNNSNDQSYEVLNTITVTCCNSFALFFDSCQSSRCKLCILLCE